MLDWIEFELGEDWDGGKIYLRISAIHAVLGSAEHPGESIVHTSDNAFDVVGTPEKIMEMISARAGTGNQVLSDR